MSFPINSPKTSNTSTIPILHGTKCSPSIEKSSHQHRPTFHLSNILHTLTKFSRNIRTTNSFIRSTSTNSHDQQVKLTRRSFNKTDQLSTSINRPSSCFILLTPSKQEHETCLFFQKPTTEYTKSPKLNSSFNKIKRVSSFLLPLKRRQSLSLNHSLHDRSFKAKESTKRRSRLLNYSIFRHKNPLITNPLKFSGKFGYKISQINSIPINYIPFDIIHIDLILQIKLNTYLFNNYQSISYDIIIPNWLFIKFIKPFYGVLFSKQILFIFQPKLFDNNIYKKNFIYHDFIYLPYYQIKSEDNNSIDIGYDLLSPTTIQIPLKWIRKINASDYQISSKVCLF